AEPAHVVLDRIDVLLLLLGRVGVVEAQMAAAAVFLGHPEVQADRFGVPDMEIAIGLGGKPGDYIGVAPGSDIGVDDVADKIAARLRSSGLFRHHVPGLITLPMWRIPARPPRRSVCRSGLAGHARVPE